MAGLPTLRHFVWVQGNSPMRVCFISHSAGRYGAELALLELLQGLLRSGIEVLVLVPKKGPFLDELDRLNIGWRIIGYPVWMSRPRALPYRVARLLKQQS